MQCFKGEMMYKMLERDRGYMWRSYTEELLNNYIYLNRERGWGGMNDTGELCEGKRLVEKIYIRHRSAYVLV